MRPSAAFWIAGAAVLGALAYALAEDVTLTTYYPSPRGVYKEVRVGSTEIMPPTTATLHVRNLDPISGLAVRVDDEDDSFTFERDETPFVVTNSGQVGIGTVAPQASALVELASSAQGLLPPRMSTAQRAAITGPATGLLIFNTDPTVNAYEFWDGTAWKGLGGLRSGDVAAIAKVGYRRDQESAYYGDSCGGNTETAYSAGSYWEQDPREVAALQPASGTVYKRGGGGEDPITCTPWSGHFRNAPSVSCAAGYTPVLFEGAHIGEDGSDDGATCGGTNGGDGFQSFCNTYYCKKN
ncbi:MAG: hypothetical protein HYY15_02475 [Candidatus Omnitrophica bacterium]|nr:hypothetical protein [Candidatus Omnitrophota bacterium]